ncbi:hypothetical protein AR454_21780 [Bacillus mycoides]|uniref:ATP-grasp domain-containing protein n=1 Tax=Bacillus mycoides TaxID=1405 RepID=UPI001E6088D8|nr:ATP-grasp domain-containing protein [Bacillus mycoides]MCD4644869.1 hypothetical protein [Bacillus mycoides]
MSHYERILIIGGGEKILSGAKESGLEVISIQKQEQFKESFFQYADKTFVFDYEEVEALLPIVKGIYEAYQFQYVISMTETGLIPAALINDMLGLPGNSVDTVRLLKDKLAMRCLLNSKGISRVIAESGKTRDDIEKFGNANGWPIIVKPIDGAGSFGIFCINDLSQIDSAWKEIQDLNLGSFIMEEFLQGPEVSVEAFSSNGNHVVVAITDKLTLPNFVEIGHSVPAQINETIKDEIVETVVAMLDAVGLKNGPSHTEIRLTKNGPRIVESHNRVGGDKIHDLVEYVYGIDMVAMACASPFGRGDALTSPPKSKGGAAIRFFTPPTGSVKAIGGVEEIKEHPAVKEIVVSVQVGSNINPIVHSPDRKGYIIVQAKDAQETISLCDELAQKIKITIE